MYFRNALSSIGQPEQCSPQGLAHDVKDCNDIYSHNYEVITIIQSLSKYCTSHLHQDN